MKKSLTLILLLALSFTLCVLLSSFVKLALEDNISKGLNNVISYCTIIGGTIGLMALFSKRYGWKIPNFRPRMGRINFTAILCSFLSIIALNHILQPVMDMIPSDYLDGMYDTMNGGIWGIISIVILAPILEEFLFRGIVQRNLVRYIGAVGGIAVASAIFGAIHIIPQQIIAGFCSGIVIGMVYEVRHSMTTVVMIHALNNGFAYLCYMYLGRDGEIFDVFGLSAKGENFLYFGCVVFVVLMFLFALRRVAKRQK